MTLVHDILKQMPGLSQPQRKFLATLFVTILVLRGRGHLMGHQLRDGHLPGATWRPRAIPIAARGTRSSSGGLGRRGGGTGGEKGLWHAYPSRTQLLEYLISQYFGHFLSAGG